MSLPAPRLRPGRAVPAPIQGLVDLALNLAWTRTNAAESLWRAVDSDTWRKCRNPWLILQTVSESRLEELAADTAFCRRLQEDVSGERSQLCTPGWFDSVRHAAPLTTVAYFSLEFGLSDALPIYAGGLGVLAGDHLKGASDLGVPMVGVGLLYQQGYFRQMLDSQGRQTELYPFNDPGDLPIQPVHSADGARLLIPLLLWGRTIWLRAWRARVGRVPLYLLDFNDPRNVPADRGITSELYGGGPELRLQQEAALGFAGWRLLQALGIHPEVCHLNEGHAAFVVLARAKAFMDATGVPFDIALETTRAGNVFTTHTPVAAGFDRFEPDLAERYLSVLGKWIGIDPSTLMALGRENSIDESEPFNMAYLAVRGSGRVNGVSRLHGAVSRRIFSSLFPRWPLSEVPVGHVTNGVHIRSWASAETDAVFRETCGADVWCADPATAVQGLRRVSSARLWRSRGRARQRLVAFARDQLARQLRAEGRSVPEVEEAQTILDADALTIGSARRLAGYKRPNLLLTDPDRLAKLLIDAQRPVQILVAGKAHPRDPHGKSLVEGWVRFVRRPDVRARALFLSDYDLLLAERLVEGVDLWLNTPRRPWEASGTSGMKVAVNGGLNLSELDGWWDEAYTTEVGWALGDRGEHDDDAQSDLRDAEALYHLLEHEVVPCFYDRDEHAIPQCWVSRMRESMMRLTPQYSSNRMVRDYTLQAYLPGAARLHRRTRNHGELATKISSWRQRIKDLWPSLHVSRVSVSPQGDNYHFCANVYLGGLSRDEVRVQLYTDARVRRESRCISMVASCDLVGSSLACQFEAQAPADRPESDYTVRIVPYHPDIDCPLEQVHIFWADQP